MGDATIKAITWLALGIQLLVGVAVARHKAPSSLIPLLNLVAGGAVLVYWGERWFGYLFRGITWYVTDQWIPAYALLVCVLAGLTLAGRYQGAVAHWLIFGINTLVLLAAALFFTSFRMTRLF